MGSLVAMTGDCKSPLFGVRWFESTLAHILLRCGVIGNTRDFDSRECWFDPSRLNYAKKWFLFKDIWDNLLFTIRINVDALARKGSSLKSTSHYAKDSSYSITLLNMWKLFTVRVIHSPLAKWLRHHPFTVASRVRFSYGLFLVTENCNMTS